MSMARVFNPGDRVRLIDGRAVAKTKRRPGMPQDVDLVVDRIFEGGTAISVRGYPGIWKSERFEAAE
jgi:hypothetical protein